MDGKIKKAKTLYSLSKEALKEIYEMGRQDGRDEMTNCSMESNFKIYGANASINKVIKKHFK